MSTRSMSRDAYGSVAGMTGTMRADVLAHIVSKGRAGATCDEVEAALGMTHQTASARVHELMRAGVIEPVGKRKTRSGRGATVWVRKPLHELGEQMDMWGRR